jgi:hypothetical protein
MARLPESLGRQTKAVALRLAGLDFASIAAQLGYTNRNDAVVDVQKAISARVEDGTRSIDELREIELLRLDRLQAAAWAKALTGDLKSIELSMKIIDRRCKLLGLDAPERHEVVTLDWLDSQIRELQARIAARVADAAPATVEGTSGPAELN